MLKIENVHKYFNKGKRNEIHVINNTSLKLGDNGLVALLGPSGCGKTTLLNCIGGLDKIKKGTIYINDKKISSKFANKADEIRNLNVGYIFQDYKLIDNETVFDNIALVLTMIGIKDKEEIKTRVEYCLDKVGMLRYKRRPAGMLSGGERQRVGIARALVKNPNIILADEPTGNLDSKNSLEIMRIIKAISKDRLVVLVTHEQDLAKFYADRIIEISDGSVINDYENNDVQDLDYVVDNTFYLKDLDKADIKKNDNKINIYTDNTSEPINLDIVVKKGNIYIRSNTFDKIEVIDENSSIEMVDEHYKKIDKSDFDNYSFGLDEVINKDAKLKYSSIFNPITLITNGFKKVFDFSVLKKILLAGFVLSGGFIMYAVSTIYAAISVTDRDFVTYNKNYLMVSKKEVKADEIVEIEKMEEVNYALPGSSVASFRVKFPFFYQTYNQAGEISGSLADLSMITEDDLIYGTMPTNKYEVVVDEFTIDNYIKYDRESTMVGASNVKDFLNLYMETTGYENAPKYKIVGITSLNSPSIYVDNEELVNIVTYDRDILKNKEFDLYNYSAFLSDELYLKQGRTPVNDYEVIVNLDHKEEMPINKDTYIKANGKKLKVVGYYVSKRDLDIYLVSSNTLKYDAAAHAENFVIYSNDKDATITALREQGYNINDSYEYAKKEYKANQQEYVNGVLLVSGIILLISLIEIFLMIRSSFLSRIKEVGIYRAIGVKKSDIYKMFFGEIFAITTLASIPGLIFAAYCLFKLSNISMLGSIFRIDIFIVILTIIFVYLFNLLIGLLPVFNTIKHKPAEILARHDLD